MESVSPIHLVQSCAAALANHTGSDAMRIRCHADAHVPSALPLDAGRVRQVILNLGRNALEHAGPGPIELQVTMPPGAIRFTVRDHGPGLPADPGHPGPRRRGLGLKLCHLLAVELGGRIGHRKTEQGFEIWLELPAGRGSGDGPARPRVLLVEDVAYVAERTLSLLRAVGCEARHAASAQAARIAIDETTFDLVLIDLELPDLPGLELMLALRRHPALAPDALLAALSAHGGTRIQPCLDAGFDAFIQKPLSPEKLAPLLARLPRPPVPVAESPLAYLARVQPSSALARSARFREAISAEVAAMRGCLSPLDRTKLQQSAHRLVTLGRNGGDLALAEAAGQLETSSAHAASAELPDAVARLVARAHLLRERLAHGQAEAGPW